MRSLVSSEVTCDGKDYEIDEIPGGNMSKAWPHRAQVLATVAPLLMLGIPASAQTKAGDGSKESVYAELTKAPRKAVVRRNPLQSGRDAVAAGAKLFSLHCAECHGDMAQGGKKAQSACAGSTASHSWDAFLALDERRGPTRHARMVQASRTSALAIG
jgi:mono/diheme cytochrome c family protein